MRSIMKLKIIMLLISIFMIMGCTSGLYNRDDTLNKQYKITTDDYDGPYYYNEEHSYDINLSF